MQTLLLRKMYLSMWLELLFQKYLSTFGPYVPFNECDLEQENTQLSVMRLPDISIGGRLKLQSNHSQLQTVFNTQTHRHTDTQTQTHRHTDIIIGGRLKLGREVITVICKLYLTHFLSLLRRERSLRRIQNRDNDQMDFDPSPPVSPNLVLKAKNFVKLILNLA